MLPAAPGWAGAACCVPPGKTHPHIPAWLPWSSHPRHSTQGPQKSQTQSQERHLQGCPYISQELGWTTLSGRRLQAGLSQTSALGSVLVGAGKPQGREGGFLSRPWSQSGFAKSISPLILGWSLALWSGSRPVTRQAPPGPLTWSGGGESQQKRPLVGRLGPAPIRAQAEPRALGWAEGKRRGPAVPCLPGGQPEVPRAGPGEVSRALFPGAGGVWPGASLGSEILTKPMSCLSTALSHCPGSPQPQPRGG